jgi:hypothetical protein
MSESIHVLIPKIAAEIGAISKDKRNQQQGYNFRGIDDVYNACQGPMTKHGVFTTTSVADIKREERTTKQGGVLIYTTLTLSVKFHGPAGDYIETVTAGEGMDSGDKSTNKAMSAALKYAFFQTFTIPTQEMVDTETETHEIAPRQQAATKSKADSKPPMSEEQRAFNAWVKPLINSGKTTSEGVRVIVEHFKGDYAAARAEIEKNLPA